MIRTEPTGPGSDIHACGAMCDRCARNGPILFVPDVPHGWPVRDVCWRNLELMGWLPWSKADGTPGHICPACAPRGESR